MVDILVSKAVILKYLIHLWEEREGEAGERQPPVQDVHVLQSIYLLRLSCQVKK